MVQRIYRATDACGNSIDVAQMITIGDQESPTIACPPPLMVECIDDAPAPATSLDLFLAAGGQADDNCAGLTILWLGDEISSTDCPLTVMRQYRAVDPCGNAVQCAQVITVDDIVPPSVTCPQDLTLDCNQWLTFQVDGADNCVGDLTFSAEATSEPDGQVLVLSHGAGFFSVLLAGSNSPGAAISATTTLTATDACGNQGQCAFTVSCEEPALSCAVSGGGETDNTPLGNQYHFQGEVESEGLFQQYPGGRWVHDQRVGPQGTFTFESGTVAAPPGAEILFVGCSDPGTCDPRGRGPAKQVMFEGVGSFTAIPVASGPIVGIIPGVSLHWFEVHAEDLAVPNANDEQPKMTMSCPPGGYEGMEASCGCPDYYSITIYEAIDPTGEPNMIDVIYHVEDYVDLGDLDIHGPASEDEGPGSFRSLPGAVVLGGAPDPSAGGVGGGTSVAFRQDSSGRDGESVQDGADSQRPRAYTSSAVDDPATEIDTAQRDDQVETADKPEELPIDVINSGVLAPARVGGLMEISGNYVQTRVGALLIEIGGLRPIADYDVLQVAGRAELSGLLAVELLDHLGPRTTDRFRVLEAGAVTGAFDRVQLRGGAGRLSLEVEYESQGVAVVIDPDPGMADLTGDGVVDHRDLVRLIEGLDGDNELLDLNSDGTVGILDVTALLQRWQP
jgi:hypothetical protein